MAEVKQTINPQAIADAEATVAKMLGCFPKTMFQPPIPATAKHIVQGCCNRGKLNPAKFEAALEKIAVQNSWIKKGSLTPPELSAFVETAIKLLDVVKDSSLRAVVINSLADVLKLAINSVRKAHPTERDAALLDNATSVLRLNSAKLLHNAPTPDPAGTDPLKPVRMAIGKLAAVTYYEPIVAALKNDNVDEVKRLCRKCASSLYQLHGIPRPKPDKLLNRVLEREKRKLKDLLGKLSSLAEDAEKQASDIEAFASGKKGEVLAAHANSGEEEEVAEARSTIARAVKGLFDRESEASSLNPRIEQLAKEFRAKFEEFAAIFVREDEVLQGHSAYCFTARTLADRLNCPFNSIPLSSEYKTGVECLERIRNSLLIRRQNTFEGIFQDASAVSTELDTLGVTEKDIQSLRTKMSEIYPYLDEVLYWAGGRQ